MNKLLLLLLPAAAMAPFILPTDDFESIPPEPASVEAGIAKHALKLGAATKLISEATNGQVAQASINPENGEVSATVYGGGKSWTVTMGQDGKVVSKEEVARFPGWAVSGDWTETESGLKFYDIEVGDGPTPPSSASTVKVHYTGYLTTGKKFDSSVDRGTPATFPLNRVIAGWTEGVGSMTVGSKRKLIIPYGQAYGANGRPPSIPPKATLIFDVELIEIIG
ncbi:MAG: FKBP-type peptidyl-prolyl cis-trans isomerase [Planctomycetes bacterium]|nr:FKBP-type peptidyl-prolyl cis-trans isomerase [Planctomycetota bacterium]